jgi:hypothetical protein
MSDVQGAEANAGADNAQVAQTGDIEPTARRMGWRPKEEFKGDESKWTDAESFVAERFDDLPKLRRTVRDMTEKFSRVEGELRETKQVLTDFREFASRSEQRAYERARYELQAKQMVAVASADTEAYAKVQAEIEQLDKNTKPQTTAKPAGETARTDGQVVTPPPKAITDWIGNNPWFNDDQELHEVAKGFDSALKRAHPGMDLEERLALVKAKVQQNYPEKFGNPRRDAAGSVLTPGASPQRKKGKTYDDLPAEAKKICDRFVKTIPPDRNGKKFTREQYVAAYDWSGE